MSQRELDEAVAQIRSEHIDDRVVRESAGRVFGKLFDSAYIAAEKVDKIRGCHDIQLLIPSYVAGTLPKPRALLVEDHVLGCIDCRHALQQQRHPAPIVEMFPASRSRKSFPMLAWGLAATLVVGIALGITGAMHGILPGQHTIEATVESFQGSLYRVSDLGATILEAGAVIRNSDELRTAKGSRAIIRLAGGAKLELAERTDVTVTAAWHGTDVNLARGRMIVQSSDLAQKTFYVTSGNVSVPVHGAVLALNHGSLGSRIAVAQGSMQIEQGRLKNTYQAGQSFATSNALYRVPITSDFDWSQNADQYISLLNELSSLQKSIQAIPAPGLRYASTLAPYLPANTVVYAAIPNIGSTLAQAKQMFDSRLAESEVLRNWWQQQPMSKDGQFDKIVDQVSSLSGYLGNELVLGFTSNGGTQHGTPVFLAQLTKAGLADYIATSLPANSGIHIVTSGASVSASPGGLFVDLDNNLVVASPDLAVLQQVEQNVQSPAGSSFSSTPLFARVGDVYKNGAGYFLATDLEQLVGKSVKDHMGQIPPGLSNAQFLVLERKEVSGTTEMRAAVSFDGARQGVASWLAAPGPVGSLDFVSPDASLAASMVMKNPRAMLQEIIAYGTQSDPNFTQHLDQFQTQSGVNLLDDVAAPLGNDVTFAIDGPGLPISSWKVAMEVNDSGRLDQTIRTLLNNFNQQSGATKVGQLTLSTHQTSGRTIYVITSSKVPELQIDYTYTDGYLLASSSEANLFTAIQNKQAGRTLATSPSFLAQLPADSYTNFSALFYQNLGGTLSAIGDQVKSVKGLTPQQKQSLSAVLTDKGPGLLCVYGERDRIVAASTGSFLGLDLGSLAGGIQQGKPLVPLIAANTAALTAKSANSN